MKRWDPLYETLMSPSIVTDEISQKKRIRRYDIRVASQYYSNIAGILSGFAFTTIILVAQENDPLLTSEEIIRRNLAAVGFFVAFFGCILASFVFAQVAAEEALTPRANQMVFFCRSRFLANY